MPLLEKADILCNKIVSNFVSKMASEKAPPLCADVFGMFPYMGYRPWAGINPVLYYVHVTSIYSIVYQQFLYGAHSSDTEIVDSFSVWLLLQRLF